MNEIKRITALFEDLYNGAPWIDETLSGTLENMPAELAAKKIAPGWNSIWEITNHLILWRENVLQRVQGVILVSPEDNYFEPIIDQSENAWQLTLQALENSQDKWLSFLETITEEDLQKIYPVNNATHYKHIHGIIQHDAYHLGQIVMLSKK